MEKNVIITFNYLCLLYQFLKAVFCLQSAVWTMKFSLCGRLLATGGQDNLLYIWILKDAFMYFDEMRRKYSTGENELTLATVNWKVLRIFSFVFRGG